MTAKHVSVLYRDALAELCIRPGGIYIDATYGRGGHSRGILQALEGRGQLIAIDKDRQAEQHALTQFADEPLFQFKQGSFVNIDQIAESAGLAEGVDGILMDLGVSSPQLDSADRGFSFRLDGPLDMRMDRGQGETAAEWLHHASEDDITYTLRDYGEERFARRIARKIVEHRVENRIERTGELANLIRGVVPNNKKDKKDPATRSFQALRIRINQELEDLKLGLQRSVELLKPQGRLVVISFHSLEDRIVKRYLRDQATVSPAIRKMPVVPDGAAPILKLIGKARKPGEEEVSENPRARSAVMRVAERLS